MFFPVSFFEGIILVSLVVMAGAALALIIMLVKDIQNNKLW